MEWKVVFFVFATSILAFARRGSAFVPRPYEELQSNLADKVEEEIAERNVNTRDSSGMLYLFKNCCVNREKLWSNL